MKKIILLLSVFALTLGGCKKEEGPAGANGIDGNANVTSNIVNVTSWIWSGANDLYYSSFNVSSITQDIIDNGAILTYLQTSGFSFDLPYTLYVSSTVQKKIDCLYGVNLFEVFVQYSDLGQYTSPNPMNFKIVTIPASQLILHPDVNFKNYEEVVRVFELED